MSLLLPRAARPLYALDHFDHARDDAPVAPAVEDAPDGPAPATLDPDRQTEARRYARQRHTLALISLALDAALIAILLFSGLSFALRDALAGAPAWEPVAGWLPARIGLYFLVLFAGGFLLGLPLSYYSGHVLPHRYGLSTQSRRAWALDLLKGMAISLPFELVAVEFVYWLLAASPDLWWLWTGAAMLFVTVILANLAPILFLPLFYKLTPLPDGEVRRMALALAERTGTRVRGIYSMNMSTKTTAANAMVMGLGNTRRVVLGDTLLDRYTPDEIEVVLAHELGHQVHGDIPRLIAVQTAVTLGGLFAVNLLLHAVVARFTAYHGLSDAATMPLVGAALAAFALVTLPLSNGFSRRVEHQADVYALETTRKPHAFISAMTRLANQNLAELEPAWFVELLLYNHPSIARRLALGRRYAERATGEPSGAPIS